MKGIIKKFQDYLKSQETKEPIDARTLTLDVINQHFQLLADSATDIRIDESQYSLPDITDKDPRKLNHLGYPCITATYYFEGEAEAEFEKCAKWANRAANIFESDSEFTVIVEENEMNEPIINHNNRTYQTDFRKIGMSIIIIIFNKRIPNFHA